MYNILMNTNMETLKMFTPLIVINTILSIICVIDILRNWDRRENKVLWLLLVIFINTIGPVVYLAVGRKSIK